MNDSEMPPSWQTTKLRHVAEYVNGFAFSPSDWGVEGDPIIRIQNLNDHSKPYNCFAGKIDSRYRIHAGDVLISWSASLGAYMWEGRDAWLNQHIFKVSIKEDVVDRTFFYYLIKSRIAHIAGLTRGSTMKHVTRKTFLDVEISLPPLLEQQSIARMLKSAQLVKDLLNREIGLERECKATLMQHLFTYGNRGEITKKTEIGEMPESWRLVELGEISRIASGGTPNRGKPEYWQGAIPWVKTGEINYNKITSTEEMITRKGLENSAARVIPSGTLLMAMYGQGKTRGRVAILGIDAAVNQACAAIFTSEQISTEFLFHFLTYDYSRIRNLGHGANQRNMNSIIIRSIKIPLPNLKEQQTIATALNACDIKKLALERELASLDELLDALLNEFMTGRLSINPLTQRPTL